MNLYHLSEENLDGVTLIPRIPDNFMTRKGYEDNKTKRISFSKSINGALMGISSNLTGKIFYVHEPVNNTRLKIKEITDDDVPDASITGEVWVLNRTKLKHVKTIKVTDSKSSPVRYKYGEFWADIYKWEYIDLN